MRKFKFMSKAVVGMMAVAMTMGSLSGVAVTQPMAVYAEAGDLTATLSTTKVPEGKDAGTDITFKVTKEGTDGDYDGAKITAVKKGSQDATADVEISSDGKKITVKSTATAGTYTVTITDDVQDGKTTTADFDVVAQSFVVTADKVEAPAGETTEITFQAGQGIEGEVVTVSAKTVTYTMSYTVAAGDTVTKIESNKLTIGPDVPANTDITVTATEADTNDTATVKISVKTKQDDNKPGTGKLEVTEIDYNKFTITIKDSAAKYAFLEVWKFGDKNAPGFGNDKDKKSADYGYKLTNGEITVDLSFLKLGKTAQGIKIYTDAHTDPVEKVIKAQPGKIKLKWDGKKAADFDYSKSTDAKGTALTAAVLKSASYEYKGQYDKDWISMADFDKVDHISAGSNIIVRQAATATDPAGPEVKVKIASLPKAPKVTIDYKKNTVKITDKMQYAYSTKPEDWQPGPKSGFSIDALRKGVNAAAADEVVVFVHTAGGSNKLDSNVTSVVLPPLAAITDNNKDAITVGDKSLKYEEAELGKDKEKGYKLTGTGFESTTDDPSKENRTWKAISTKGLEVKSGDTVYIRLAGVKGSKTNPNVFASDEIKWTAPAAEAEAPEITVTVSVKQGSSATVTKPTTATDATVELEATAKDKDNKEVEIKSLAWALDAASAAEGSGVSIDSATGKVTITQNATVATVKVTATADGVKSEEFTITITDGTQAQVPTSVEMDAAVKATFTAGANATNNLELALIIKDAQGNTITNPSGITVEVTKTGGSGNESGFSYENGKLVVAAANNSGPTLTAGDVYTVTVKYNGTALTTTLELTVGA